MIHDPEVRKPSAMEKLLDLSQLNEFLASMGMNGGGGFQPVTEQIHQQEGLRLRLRSTKSAWRRFESRPRRKQVEVKVAHNDL